jgi:light-regulated signal transduction histidine kinase (bacteriophytochrome)
MQQEGYRVEEASDGEQCLSAYTRLHPDIILLDAMMPIMDGFTCCTQLQTLPDGKRTPVLMITGLDDRVSVDRAFEAGAIDYVTKPIHWPLLRQRVRRLLQARWATMQLEVTNKELEAFSYSVSHDLRAPVRIIQGFAQILMEDYADKLDLEGKQYLTRMCENTQRMSELIDDLLSLSGVTSSQMHYQTVDLSALAQRIATHLQQTQPERLVQFVIAQGLIVNGDRRLLQIVLENLLNNAWKFTGKLSQARIEIGVTLNQGQQAYFVRDNGVGFDMIYADKLFTAFQRLHSSTEFPGTGIGLATVQRIIRRHGGRVWAEAAVGQGATFYFTF